MARRSYKRSHGDGYSGDALKDGFTCSAVSPLSAPNTDFMSKSEAAEYDATEEMMSEFGDRKMRRRLDADYEDWEL